MRLARLKCFLSVVLCKRQTLPACWPRDCDLAWRCAHRTRHENELAGLRCASVTFTRRQQHRLHATAAALLAVAVSYPVAAQIEPAESTPRRVEIRWQAPAPCPSEGWFVNRVAAFLGRPLDEAASENVHGSSQVTRSDGAYRGELKLRIGAEAEQRQLADPDCTVLADALAFVLASAIDPLVSYERAPALEDVGEHGKASETANDNELPVAASSPKPAGVVPQPSASELQPRFALGAVIGSQFGILPEVAWLLGVSGELKLGIFRAQTSAAALLPQRLPLRNAEARGDFQAGLVSLDACLLVKQQAVEIPVCANLELGAVRGESAQVSDPRAIWLPWIRTGLATSAAVPLGEGLALRGAVATGLVAVRPRFSLDGEVVHEAQPIAGSAAISLEWRFE
jgi:hypothetical protein